MSKTKSGYWGRGGGGGRGGEKRAGGRGRGGTGGGFNAPIGVSEDFRMAVNLRLQDFRNREDEKEYEFPTSLASTERCYIHRLAKDLGLQTKSRLHQIQFNLFFRFSA